ncbi:hypothetical protein RHGRI_012118 [Rhododendron griersonianum]|uniref:Uncharacterized protein n=2 Tax=Rhododendron griersonianum TaxID=479676 RepID=A0AAV6KQM6_9ERIC|nr:hypothetical protein RHGRI_012118 [Rhododendron griersonianum]
MILKATTKTSFGKMNKMGKQLSLPSARRNLKQERIGSDTLRFEPGTYLNQKEKLIKYSDFVYKELILFSMADLQQSIPSITSGTRRRHRADDQMLKLWGTAEAKTLRALRKKKKSVGHQFEDVKQKSVHLPSSESEVEKELGVDVDKPVGHQFEDAEQKREHHPSSVFRVRSGKAMAVARVWQMVVNSQKRIQSSNVAEAFAL